MDYIVIDPANVAEAQKFMEELCSAKPGEVVELPKPINPYLDVARQFYGNALNNKSKQAFIEEAGAVSRWDEHLVVEALRNAGMPSDSDGWACSYFAETELPRTNVTREMLHKLHRRPQAEMMEHKATRADLPAIRAQELTRPKPVPPEPATTAKPAITGLTAEWQGDHRLGMFK